MIFCVEDFLMLLQSKQKKRHLQAFLLGLLVSGIFLGIYMIKDKGLFLYYGDFNVQQIPFYQLAHRAVKSGDIFWNWNTDLGVNFIGSYSFYLIGSPFFWLTIPFPNSWVPYLMGPLLMLKFACASLTAYMYISRFTRYTHNALIGGLLYAFSGFSVYNVFFNHFHEAIIYLPLLLLSLELFMTENRRGLFAIMVCLCSISNYYFFFGMVIFVVIYFFIKLGSGSWKMTLPRFFALAFEAVIGLTMSAVVLLPSIYTVLQNSRATSYISGWGSLTYGRGQILLNIIQCFFFPPDNPARPVFFPDADIKWSSISGWIPLFGMTGAIAWLQAKKGTWQKRLITTCMIFALIPVLNAAFSMFNYGYYARWFYMPVLIVCLVTAQSLEQTDINWASAMRWSIGITLAITLGVGLLPSKYSAENGFENFGLYTEASKDGSFYHLRFWLTCAIAIGSLIVLLVLFILRDTLTKRKPEISDGEYIHTIRKNTPVFWRSCVAAICIITVVYAGVHIGWGKTHSFNTTYINETVINGEINLDIGDGERIDVYKGMDNTAMFFGYPTIQAFHSVVPASIFDFYDYVDIERSVGSRPEVSKYQIRSLLAVRYLIDYADDSDKFSTNSMPGFNYIKTENSYDIYENQYYIPYGFTYDYSITESAVETYYSSYKAQTMLKAMVLSEEQARRHSDILTPVTSENVFAPSTFDRDGYIADCEKLRATSIGNTFTVDNGGFTSTVNLERENLVFYSVPYEDGWSATVDGEPVKVEKANVGFMAVRVPAGEHTVRFDYMTPGLITGAMVTLASAVILAGYMLICIKLKKKNPDKFAVEAPELEALNDAASYSDAAETAFTGEEPTRDTDLTARIISRLKRKSKSDKK